MESLIFKSLLTSKQNKQKLFLLLFFPFVSLPALLSQQQLSPSDIAAIVTLDSFEVTASREGFNVTDFIEMVRNDRSFYEAFRNLRFVAYSAENDIQFYNRKGASIASLKSTIF